VKHVLGSSDKSNHACSLPLKYMLFLYFNLRHKNSHLFCMHEITGETEAALADCELDQLD